VRLRDVKKEGGKMSGKTISKMVAAILGISLASGSTASGGFTFTGPAAFTAGGAPKVTVGGGAFVDTTMLVNKADGFALSNGTWTYTSVAGDMGLTVEIAYGAERPFIYTPGNNYITNSSINVTALGPAGVVGDFFLQTKVMGIMNTTSAVDPPFLLNGFAVPVVGSKNSPQFAVGVAGADVLVAESVLEFTPTAAGQVFTFTFAASLDSSLGTVPEPSSFPLVLLGATTVFLSSWYKRQGGWGCGSTVDPCHPLPET
jgi:hypothetical protein